MTQTHSLVDVDVEEKDVACRTHAGELIRFYCEPCGACICVVCAFQQPHHDHDVSTFSEAISKHRHALDGLLGRCRDRAEQLRTHLELTARWAVNIRTAEQQVYMYNYTGIQSWDAWVRGQHGRGHSYSMGNI